MNGPWLLTKKDQYSTVYQKGNAYVNRLIVIKVMPNRYNFSRYGFSVSKAVGKAVIRNRVKRRLKEICRLQKISPGWDIVVIARRGAGTAQYYQLRDVLIYLLIKARVLFKNSETTGTDSN